MSRLKFAVLPVGTAVALAGWAADPLVLPEGFTLSEPVRFVNVVDSSECQLLRFNGHSFGYVATVRRADDNLVLETCERTGPWETEGGARVEGWARGWFLAQSGGTDLTRIEVEGIGIFSNPSPCGDSIAYWVSKDLPGSRPGNEYFAHVADLLTNELLEQQYLGEAWTATDYKFHFPLPEWGGNCAEVLFGENQHFEPVTLRSRASEPAKP